MPTQASDQARNALDSTALGSKGELETRAHAQVTTLANDAALDARLDAATRAADGAVAAAEHGASADIRAAAEQAQASTARATGAAHRGGKP